ncbi:MAG TPA: hypothetical protein VG323_00225 [Thermoanaerobaculia bacterium]|nr:hypothetical protein [Thermoanaerobaculia bacterium]
MQALLALLLLTAVTIPTPTLFLRGGGRLDVDGSVSVDNGRVLFRSSGVLYSIPEADVDLTATRAAEMTSVVRPDTKMRLKVSEAERDRLLRELEQNHSGTPSTAKLPAVVTVEEPMPPPGDEWSWRRDAQVYEESIRRAREELDLLTSKAAALRSHIAGLLSLGYKPQQFTYDSTQLQYTVDQIPRAELEVARAEREYAQFRENARRQGVLPGWLR